MSTYNGFKVAALAASIALAMAATSAMAADPATNALPGQGKVVAGTLTAADVTIATGTSDMTVANGAASNVINWGANATATGLNNNGTAGFNIGSKASVDFTGAGAVLNIDSTGNASQIFGALSSAGAIFVANSNGIIVGATGDISGTGAVGLIANTLDSTPTFTGTGVSGGLVYNGTGGDVTVQPGATVTAGTTFIAGGGNVNVDLGNVGGTITLTAGLPSVGAFTTKNAAATVTATGSSAGSVIDSLSSAGTATTNGNVTITAATGTTVAGVLTNNGQLTLTGNAGKVHNQGQLASGTGTFTSLVNDGSYAASGVVNVNGGSLTNNGDITNAGAVKVTNGTIVNSGSIAGVSSLGTASTDAAGSGFTAGGQYFINNTGTISSTADLLILANAAGYHTTVVKNDSTGSFTNTGTLQVAAANDGLTIGANNSLSLGGTLKAGTKVVSDTNALGLVSLVADAGLKETGVLSVLTPVSYTGGANLSGAQVKVMDNVSGGAAAGSPLGALIIKAGAAQTDDYAVRVASGKTASGATISVTGYTNDSPNTILQGTLSAGNVITFGASGAGVGDIISGPAGGMTLAGAAPIATLWFNGRIKTAPYLNDPNNFRYNYLPISAPNAATGTPLVLNLNPVSYTTNGTSNGLSGVNVLVNGSVFLASAVPGATVINGTGSAVTGVTNVPNTHVVLQSTGDITTAGGYYWPGYVYLGNIDSDTSGNALAGTLGGGKITLLGDFSNVLPGDVAGASGIHFMTGNALVASGKVTTNANALVNFATDLLTQNYAQGILGTPSFFGGVASGLIVNYGALDASMFNTHLVDATK